MNIGLLLVAEFGQACAEFAHTLELTLQDKGHALYLVGEDSFGVMTTTLTTIMETVDFKTLLQKSDPIPCHYSLSGQRAGLSIFVYTGSALPQPLHALLVVCPREHVAQFPALPEAILLPYPKPHRKYSSGKEMTKSQHGLMWFAEQLEEYLLTFLEEPELFITELDWQTNLRLRKEDFGGILFVPKTSQLVLLDDEMYERTQESIKNNDPKVLLTETSKDLKTIASMLTARALVRRQSS